MASTKELFRSQKAGSSPATRCGEAALHRGAGQNQALVGVYIEAVIMGLGRMRGETLRAFVADGQEYLRYSGFIGRRVGD